jgi:hypothetical protein
VQMFLSTGAWNTSSNFTVSNSSGTTTIQKTGISTTAVVPPFYLNYRLM